jgi:C-terminal processing protease CtpA/Prc
MPQRKTGIEMDILSIVTLDPNGTASKAGLALGDRIISVDGKPVVSQAELDSALRPELRGGTGVVVF